MFQKMFNIETFGWIWNVKFKWLISLLPFRMTRTTKSQLKYVHIVTILWEHSAVLKITKKYDYAKKKFRQINSTVTSLVKPLIWRKNCWFFRKNPDRVFTMWKLRNHTVEFTKNFVSQFFEKFPWKHLI